MSIQTFAGIQELLKLAKGKPGVLHSQSLDSSRVAEYKSLPALLSYEEVINAHLKTGWVVYCVRTGKSSHGGFDTTVDLARVKAN